MKLTVPIGNARERFEAMKQGKVPPPKSAHRQPLPDDLAEEWLTALAKVLCREYIAEKEAGRV